MLFSCPPVSARGLAWPAACRCVALHVKSAAQRGGLVEDIRFEHNEAFNTTALMRLATFGKSVRPRGYRATCLRRVEWAHNALHAPRERRVRAKFVCPGDCSGVRVVNNSLPPDTRWQCVGVRLEPAPQLCEGSAAGSAHQRPLPKRRGRRGRRGRRPRSAKKL